MKLEKAWSVWAKVTLLSQIASIMLDASGFISVLVLGLFVVGCGLGFTTLFKLIHRFTLSANMRVVNPVSVKHEAETNLKVQIDRGANLEPATGNQEVTVTDDSEDAEWRAKLERALLREGGE